MTTFANGESGLSVRTKINNVLQHTDGTAGELVINEAGADVDFRVESDTNVNALFVDGASGNVGIGTSSPSAKVDIQTASGGIGFRTFSTSETAERSTYSAYAALQLASYQSVSGSPYTKVSDIVANGDGTVPSIMRFWTKASGSSSPAERLRIDASGNLLVGKTSVDDSLNGIALYGVTTGPYISATASDAPVAVFNRKSTDGMLVLFRKDNTLVGSVSVTGSATSYNTSSDYRLKEDLQPIADASSRLAALNPVNFAWKADGTRTDGFIAHEVQAVVPQAVTGEKDGEAMQAIDHSKLVPLLTAALQEALAKIALLETRITALEA